MSGFHLRIAELQTKAAEFKLIADLATDPDARALNEQLAEELHKIIDRRRHSEGMPLPVPH